MVVIAFKNQRSILNGNQIDKKKVKFDKLCSLEDFVVVGIQDIDEQKWLGITEYDINPQKRYRKQINVKLKFKKATDKQIRSTLRKVLKEKKSRRNRR
jgi:hypothetical protein